MYLEKLSLIQECDQIVLVSGLLKISPIFREKVLVVLSGSSLFQKTIPVSLSLLVIHSGGLVAVMNRGFKSIHIKNSSSGIDT